MDLQIGQRLQTLFDLFLAHIQIPVFEHLTGLLSAGNYFDFHLQNRVDIIRIGHIHGFLSGFSRRNIDHQFAQGQIVYGKAALSLENVNPDPGLVIPDRIQPLRPAGRDDRIPLNDREKYSVLKTMLLILPDHFRSKGKRTHIRQNHFPDTFLALLHSRLNGRPQRHGLVRIQIGVRYHMEQLSCKFPDNRRLGRSAYQHHLVNIGQPDMRIL